MNARRRCYPGPREGASKIAERSDKEWSGSPLDLREDMNPDGIAEIVIEYDTGERDVLRPRTRREFGSYELEQVSVYLGTLLAELRRNADERL